MKYRAKAEKVDAIQVRFGKGGWPEWLDGHVAMKVDGAPEHHRVATIQNGDYLVFEEGAVTVYHEDDFAAKYERVREPKKAQS